MHELQDSTNERSVTIEVTIPEELFEEVRRAIASDPEMTWARFWQGAASINILRKTVGNNRIAKYYLEATMPECYREDAA